MLFYVINIVLHFGYIFAQNLTTCKPEELKFAFTECDEFNGRYRVSIPINPDKCSGGSLGPPIRLSKCNTSCNPGTFFNSTTLTCEKCKPGYYSLGGGIRLQTFNESMLENLGFLVSCSSKSSNCSGWKVNNGLLAYNQISLNDCLSTVSYNVKIVKRGLIQFEYQYPPSQDPNIFVVFTFLHSNERDRQVRPFSYFERNRQVIPFTRDKEWKTIKQYITEPGYYSFVWEAQCFPISDSDLSSFFQRKKRSNRSNNLTVDTRLEEQFGSIKIRSFEISGVSYASECTPCEPGTYSDNYGSSECVSCPENSFSSTIGSVSCKQCLKADYFSFRGSRKCLARPECSNRDYFETISECDKNSRQYTRTYQWIEPKICRESTVKLPKNVTQSCDPLKIEEHNKMISECSPGMELINNTCRICPDNYYNDGTLSKCVQCPPTTSPIYKLTFNKWIHNTDPQDDQPSLSWEMFPKDQSDFYVQDFGQDTNQNPWYLVPGSPSYLRSSNAASLSNILILSLRITGFYNAKGGELNFRFELICTENDNCDLDFFIIKNGIGSNRYSYVTRWDQNSSGIREFTYQFTEDRWYELKWLFTRGAVSSHLRMYSITITNVINSGAIGCQSCPLSVASDCIPCAVGHYINLSEETVVRDHDNTKRSSQSDSQSSRCVKCPANTIINKTLAFPIGLKSSCIPCGKGLVSSKDRTTCQNQCNLTVDGDQYKLDAIQAPIRMKGVLLFSTTGMGYYHDYKISLCGENLVTCINNMTDDIFMDKRVIESYICRSTIVQKKSSSQSVSLGDEILAVTKDSSFANLTIHPDFNATKYDIHLYYSLKQPSNFCPKGRYSIITLRCQPDLDEEYIVQTPKSCLDGSCDGCVFHFMVISRTLATCKVCREKDFKKVVGECINGHQKIHYIGAEKCIVKIDHSFIQSRPCSLIPKTIKIGIAFISGIGLILLTLVLHFWKVNRKLEYKYSKLIEDRNTAECCAEDGEEEEEEIRVRSRTNKLDSSEYETIQLTKHSSDYLI